VNEPSRREEKTIQSSHHGLYTHHICSSPDHLVSAEKVWYIQVSNCALS
jgi:hypothetical protein